MTTTIYGNGQCNGASTDVPNDGSCVPIASSPGSIATVVSSTASCPSAGGQPIGTIAEGAVKTTVCCAP